MSIYKKIKKEAGRTDVIFLWNFPEEDYGLWVKSGCGNIGFEEYQARLQKFYSDATRDGQYVQFVNMKVSEMLRCLKKEKMGNNAINRTEILGLYGLGRNLQNKTGT